MSHSGGTKHRNAGGPFLTFDPGIGVTGSLSVNGQIAGTNVGLQVGSDTHLSGNLKIMNSGDVTKHWSLGVNSLGDLNITGIDTRKVYIDDAGSDGKHEFEGNGSYIQRRFGTRPYHALYRGNGNESSIAATEDADELGLISFGGYKTSSAVGAPARILATATEDWGASAMGAKLTFHTTDNTTDTRDERLVIDHDGQIGIGITNPLATLHIKPGTLRLQGSSGAGATLDMYADDGEDNADYWKIYAGDGGELTFKNFIGGSWQQYFTITPHATPASSTIAIPGSITCNSFTGDVTGNVTGNCSGTAATVTGAAQTNITSVGELTSLDVAGRISLDDSGTDGKTNVRGDGEIILYKFDDDDWPLLKLTRATGDSTSIASIGDEDELGGIDFRGYYTSTATGLGAEIRARAAETWDIDNLGTEIFFRTCSTGTNTPGTRLYISPAGYIGIGDTSPSHTLDVTGDINLTGGLSFDDGTAVTSIDNSTSLGTSDSKLATQKAIKAYVDSKDHSDAITSTSNGTSNEIVVYNSSTTVKGISGFTYDGNYMRINGADASYSTVAIKNNDDATTSGALALECAASTNYWSISPKSSDSRLYITYNGTNSLGAYLSTAGAWQTNANLPFTGMHRSVPDAMSVDEMMEHVGKIICATGFYKNLEDDGNKPTLFSSHPKIALSTKRKQKSVYGVISTREGDSRIFGDGYGWASLQKMETEERVMVNSLGEGGIWVCNINGNIENGDYITTCEVPGLGMKQDTEMLCNYTVAKITQDCNFRINAANYDVEEFEFEGKTYRKAFVGCTYHCG